MKFQFFDCFSKPRKLLQNQLYILFIFLCFSLNHSNYNNNMANSERTFIMLKPDAVHRGIVGDVIKRFEAKGFKLIYA